MVSTQSNYRLQPDQTRILYGDFYFSHTPQLYSARKESCTVFYSSSSIYITMAGVNLTTVFYYYYQPDFNSPTGECVNTFSSVRSLYEYIDQQISDCYSQRDDFEDCHTGTNGEVLELVNMNIEVVDDEGICIKIYDMNMSQAEVRVDAREHLEVITDLFEENPQ